MDIILTFVIRAIFALALMLFLTRFIGRHMISQMTNYHFIAAITIGSIIGNMVFNINIKLSHFILSFFIFSGIILLLTILSVKNRRLNKLISGNPTTIIKDGKILEENMRKIKYTFDMLNQGLREKGIFNIEEVSYAILEPNGNLSVLKKTTYQSVTKKDIKIELKEKVVPIPLELIIEGKIHEETLQNYQINRDWLNEEICRRGTSLKNISYAVLGTNGKLYIDLYNDIK